MRSNARKTSMATTTPRSFRYVSAAVGRRLLGVLLLILVGGSTLPAACDAQQSGGAPYRFSLTTFDPAGQLGQVQRAVQAAARGVPLIAFVDTHTEALWLAAPQRLPSVCMTDDGTARWGRVTPNIVVAHTGVGADGRLLLQRAHQIALSHDYQYGTAIPLATLLQELALVLQEATRHAGGRPGGATLLVAHLPSHGRPTLVRLDPSGSMTVATSTPDKDDGHGPYRLVVNHDDASLEWKDLARQLAGTTGKDAAHAVVADWCRAHLLPTSAAAAAEPASAETTTTPGTSLLTCRWTADGDYSTQQQQQEES
jgi:hypothetical protein